MVINTSCDNGMAIISVSGRLDTVTAAELEKKLNSILPAADDLTFDFSNLDYISSAGLRILLKAQKAVNSKGVMVLTGVKDGVMDVLNATGFSDILTIVK